MKFADDLTREVPGYDYGDMSMIEVSNIREWSERNRMQLNMEKTYEMVIISKISTPLPAGIPNINRKSWLKILGITLENVPDKCDIHFEEMMGRAAGRMYILRVCKYYGMSINQLNLLYNKDNALQELLPNKLNRPLRQQARI